jgi:sugar-specific transcriptional regulator TrmB
LVKKGCAKRIPRARKQLYFPVSADEVFSSARERLRESEGALPELRALSKEGAKNKVRTTYYEGQEQVLGAFLDTLNYPDSEVNGWLSEQPWRSTGGTGWWHSEYRPRRLEKGIYHRFIVPSVPSMEEYTKEKEMQKDVRVEHDHSFLPEADIFIYGTDHVLITSFEEKMGVMIESRLIHDTIRAIFERQWEVLK